MTRPPNQPDEFGAKLDHPLGAPHDPQLEALLDAALAADAVPGGFPPALAARIVAQTQGQLGRQRHGVLARIGPVWMSGAIAAGLVLAASLALFFAANTAARRESRALAGLTRELDALRHYTGPRDAIDQEMALFSTSIDLARVRGDWDWDALTPQTPPDWDPENDGTATDHVF